ncbi:unnamed protein product [Protopolystoma xenopodis]|uniref:Uncharacterized protein n=1 Tax=Protopolystoma xenopodis TaxID=117903 RepID=A0A3S5BNY9_9PLAT|nr:unnamed protein product [Protopolystoma xenopodis]
MHFESSLFTRLSDLEAAVQAHDFCSLHRPGTPFTTSFSESHSSSSARGQVALLRISAETTRAVALSAARWLGAFSETHPCTHIPSKGENLTADSEQRGEAADKSGTCVPGCLALSRASDDTESIWVSPEAADAGLATTLAPLARTHVTMTM